ncbi:MAG: DUF1697 domain-containing protein [Spirochaetales bacterium]|nr:DUF1697 domain-containing protein [Spirochaetales bacterium]
MIKTYVALFRGINVGGTGVLPMKDLVGILESLDLQDVKTYIQSGNVVFRSAEDEPATIAARISREIRKRFDFEPRVLLFDPSEIQKALQANPFPEAESESKTLHLSFLVAEPDNPDLESMEKIRKDSERFSLQGRIFYLHAPEGIGRSKIAASVEKLLGVQVTSRNWRTVARIAELASEQRILSGNFGSTQ